MSKTELVFTDDEIDRFAEKIVDKLNSHTRTLKALNEIVAKQDRDIKLLIGRWFSALEDEGINPWINEECVEMANKYWYTEADYKKYLNTIA